MQADDARSTKEFSWCAVSCAAACRAAQNTRAHLTATSDAVRTTITSAAVADIPDFVAVDLCARSTLSKSKSKYKLRLIKGLPPLFGFS